MRVDCLIRMRSKKNPGQYTLTQREIPKGGGHELQNREIGRYVHFRIIKYSRIIPKIFFSNP